MSEEDEFENSTDPPVEIISLLDRLKCPAKSDLSRKRKIQSNPPKGKKRSTTQHKKDPKVKPIKRVKEYPIEQLTVSGGHLFCNACRETISVKRSTVSNHIKSSKHTTSKVNLQKKEAREMDIGSAL